MPCRKWWSSPIASENGLPCSRVRSCAISLEFSWIFAIPARISAARSSGSFFDHSLNASFAAATAALTSSEPALGTISNSSSVAGFTTGISSPDLAEVCSPFIRICAIFLRASLSAVCHLTYPTHVLEPERLVLAGGHLDPPRGASFELFLDLRRHPGGQDLRRYLLVLADHALRGEHRPTPDSRPIQDDAPHPDEGPIPDLTPLQKREVPDGYVRPDRGRQLLVGVDHTVVLDAGARADDDAVEVASQNGPEPDARPVFDRHVSDEDRGRRDESAGMYPRLTVLERYDMGHTLPPRERRTAPLAGGPHAFLVILGADKQALSQALREEPQQLALKGFVEGVALLRAVHLDEESAVFQRSAQARALGHLLIASNGL